jgi:hypothetical protein
VCLKSHAYNQLSVALRKNIKLNLRIYGPCKIIQRVGAMTYGLRFPEGATIHPIFHVSLLEKKGWQ